MCITFEKRDVPWIRYAQAALLFFFYLPLIDRDKYTIKLESRLVKLWLLTKLGTKLGQLTSFYRAHKLPCLCAKRALIRVASRIVFEKVEVEST